jgi:hypothetical protein
MCNGLLMGDDLVLTSGCYQAKIGRFIVTSQQWPMLAGCFLARWIYKYFDVSQACPLFSKDSLKVVDLPAKSFFGGM